MKTNAMRLLDSLEIDYKILGYEIEDEKVDGLSVAEKLGRDPATIYKTLVTRGKEEVYVFLLPVGEELDMKKAAKLTGEKKIEMVGVNDIFKLTGYIRGGCSPLAMKKAYRTFVDRTVEDLDSLVISGGKIGSQIELSLAGLRKAIDLEIGDLRK